MFVKAIKKSRRQKQNFSEMHRHHCLDTYKESPKIYNIAKPWSYCTFLAPPWTQCPDISLCASKTTITVQFADFIWSPSIPKNPIQLHAISHNVLLMLTVWVGKWLAMLLPLVFTLRVQRGCRTPSMVTFYVHFHYFCCLMWTTILKSFKYHAFLADGFKLTK